MLQYTSTSKQSFTVYTNNRVFSDKKIYRSAKFNKNYVLFLSEYSGYTHKKSHILSHLLPIMNMPVFFFIILLWIFFKGSNNIWRNVQICKNLLSRKSLNTDNILYTTINITLQNQFMCNKKHVTELINSSWVNIIIICNANKTLLWNG